MSNQYVNKVVYGNDTLIDLTGDNVSASDVAQGVTFHLPSGQQAVGTASGGSSIGDTLSKIYVGASVAADSQQNVINFTKSNVSLDPNEGINLNITYRKPITQNSTNNEIDLYNITNLSNLQSRFSRDSKFLIGAVGAFTSKHDNQYLYYPKIYKYCEIEPMHDGYGDDQLSKCDDIGTRIKLDATNYYLRYGNGLMYSESNFGKFKQWHLYICDEDHPMGYSPKESISMVVLSPEVTQFNNSADNWEITGKNILGLANKPDSARYFISYNRHRHTLCLNSYVSGGLYFPEITQELTTFTLPAGALSSVLGTFYKYQSGYKARLTSTKTSINERLVNVIISVSRPYQDTDSNWVVDVKIKVDPIDLNGAIDFSYPYRISNNLDYDYLY